MDAVSRGTSGWLAHVRVQRIVAAGKPKKFALAAHMRKLLVILNAMLRHRTPWRPTLAT